MRKLITTVLAPIAAIAAFLAAVIAVGTASATTTGSADVAVGGFARSLVGYSAFAEQGATARVIGSYAGLRPARAYFTVAYANRTCDPAQAFPVGPFTTTDRGRGRLNTTVALPAGVDVGATGSISVRRGDTQDDLDGDGLLGPTDVVAVPGKPRIGLIECDTSPTVYGG